MPEEIEIESKIGNEIVADSCEIWFYFDKANCYGDTLTPMKMRVMELNRAMDSEATYYSNYDPEKEGYIREGGLQKDLVFTLANLTYSDSARNVKNYVDIGRVTINDPYKDKNGKIMTRTRTKMVRSTRITVPISYKTTILIPSISKTLIHLYKTSVLVSILSIQTDWV